MAMVRFINLLGGKRRNLYIARKIVGWDENGKITIPLVYIDKIEQK